MVTDDRTTEQVLVGLVDRLYTRLEETTTARDMFRAQLEYQERRIDRLLEIIEADRAAVADIVEALADKRAQVNAQKNGRSGDVVGLLSSSVTHIDAILALVAEYQRERKEP